MEVQGIFQQFWEKAPGQTWEKMIDLASKLEKGGYFRLRMGPKFRPKRKVENPQKYIQMKAQTINSAPDSVRTGVNYRSVFPKYG